MPSSLSVEGLEFQRLEPCTEAEHKASNNPVVKVAVIAGNIIRVTLGQEAFRLLGKPERVLTEVAQANGKNYLKLTPGDGGWPVKVRLVGSHKIENGVIKLMKHRFTLGLTHESVGVPSHWDGVESGDPVSVTLELPDWAQMLKDIEAGNE